MTRARYGYMGKMLFVDLTNGTWHEEELSEETARRFVGGYGIGARIILERMKPGADPLGPDNIFGIGTGPLTLSGVYAACRFATMGKSPLTGYWGDANCGGDFANAFKAAGYDIVFFEGRAEHPVYLLIQDGKVEIKDARHLWGKDTAVTEALIRDENDNRKLKVAVIGPAGERMARIAAVINDRGRAAARSGLGAVMGSKNLKAVAAIGARKPEIHDKPRVQALMREMLKEAKENPSGMFFGLTHGGSAGAMIAHLHDADVPIKNWRGNNVEDFPEQLWESVALPGMTQYLTKRYACTGCPIGCGGKVTVEEGKYPVQDAHKPEYETLAAFGTMCLNTDMKSLIYENELCDLYGLDTISAGCTLAFAIECFENGIITKADTDGAELTWGNSDAHVAVLKKMCLREGIGDVLADGAKWAAEKLGRGAAEFAMHAGGEMLAMHDPRCFPGWGATYISDSTPGRHTRGGTAFAEHGGVNEIIYGGLGIPFKLERYDPTDKGKYHALVAAWQHWANTSGACMFGIDSMPMDFVGCINAITGWGLDYPELAETGKRIATLLHGFNVREGFKPSDFKLPERARGNPPLEVGDLKGVTVDSEGLKRQFYEEMGFDFETGVVDRERITALGLEDVL
ncbi:MAG: aldehyde ferredoxin oxidoreductase family protein [Actinobacteria bacterium]|nr:aldehyde ferredoxin oxidoreductase family protein [Actinomycetota bacterium]